jgi:YVTN family beta-propeller protein
VFIAVDLPHNKIYVANSGDNTVSVINATSDKKETPDIPVGNYPRSIAVDSSYYSSYDKIYVANSNSHASVSMIDGKSYEIKQIYETRSVAGPIDMALGSIVGGDYGGFGSVLGTKIYVANSGDNTVSVINATSDKKETPDIRVGEYPSHIAVNYDKNIIYVANARSNTVSVIDGSSDKVAAGVIFNVNPANSGKIICGTKEYPTNIYLYVDFGTKCTAQPNKDFEFNSWVENLPINRNSSIPLDSSGNLTVNRYGTFTVKFVPIPPAIPPAILLPLYAIVASSLIGWSIPSIMGWVKERRQRKNLKKCRRKIGELGRNAIEEMITEYFVDGKISESQRQLLKDEIAELYNKPHGSPIK